MSFGWAGIYRQVSWRGVAVILLAALAAVAPEIARGNSCGHDFNFHLMSWLDALRAWQHGIPYPHWTPDANWGAGEPRFVFYPPLTWMLGAALGAVLPWSWVPVALTFTLLAATGLGVRSMAREIFCSNLSGRVPSFPPFFAKSAKKDGAPDQRFGTSGYCEGAATLAGCVAIFGGYALFTAYERTAFAELAGGLWMALVFKYALRGQFARGSLREAAVWRSALDGSAAALAVVVAGAWFSNPTVAVMASYLLMLLAVVAAVLERSWAPAMRAAVALPLGLGLSAVYLAPVAGEQRWADLNKVNLSPGQMLENNWLFARHADPVLGFHDFVLRQVSWIVVAMVLVTFVAMAVCWLRGRLPGGRRWWLPLAIVPVGVLLLQIPLSHAVWDVLPKLRYLQFPWRWLVALEAPMGVFVAAAVWPKSRGWQRWLVAGAACTVFAGMTAYANRAYFQVCDDEDSVPGMVQAWSGGTGFRGMDEYVPPGADNSLVAAGLPDACLASDPALKLGVTQPAAPDATPDDDLPPPLWLAGQGSCVQVFNALPERAWSHTEHFEVRAETRQAGTMILRLRSYPAWRVRVNGQAVSTLPKRDDGLVAVLVPAGPVEVAIDWRATPDVLIGRVLSALGVLLLAGLVWFERRGRAARLE